MIFPLIGAAVIGAVATKLLTRSAPVEQFPQRPGGGSGSRPGSSSGGSGPSRGPGPAKSGVLAGITAALTKTTQMVGAYYQQNEMSYGAASALNQQLDLIVAEIAIDEAAGVDLRATLKKIDMGIAKATQMVGAYYQQKNEVSFRAASAVAQQFDLIVADIAAQFARLPAATGTAARRTPSPTRAKVSAPTLPYAALRKAIMGAMVDEIGFDAAFQVLGEEIWDVMM